MISGRDQGQRLQIRDCPGSSGTVGTSARPSLNRSFTIKHAISLPLRRHSCTQSQLATSVKRHSDLIPYLARGSRANLRINHTIIFRINHRFNYKINHRINHYLWMFFERKLLRVLALCGRILMRCARS